jgi:hypothetical protein
MFELAMYVTIVPLSVNEYFLFLGAVNPLAGEHLSKQDLLLLDMLKFLCMCVTASHITTVSFKAADIRRKLLVLIDSSTLDPAQPLHLHMVSQVEQRGLDVLSVPADRM